MVRRKVEDFKREQVMERAWLIMALISSALSDHPIVRLNRPNRHCVDRARKALFDLYKKLEAEAEMTTGGRSTAGQASEQYASDLKQQDDFGAKLLRLKGTIPKSVVLDFDETPAHPAGKPSRRRRRR